jgi:hypothetical protein
MQYHDQHSAKQAQATATPQAPSLITDSASLYSNLAEIEHRLTKLGDALFGTEPRDASSGKESSPSPSVRRHLDNCDQAVARIHDILSRIESRI